MSEKKGKREEKTNTTLDLVTTVWNWYKRVSSRFFRLSRVGLKQWRLKPAGGVSENLAKYLVSLWWASRKDKRKVASYGDGGGGGGAGGRFGRRGNEKVRNGKKRAGEERGGRRVRNEREEAEGDGRPRVLRFTNGDGGWAVRAGECRAFLLVPALALSLKLGKPISRTEGSSNLISYVPLCVSLSLDNGPVQRWGETFTERAHLIDDRYGAECVV